MGNKRRSRKKKIIYGPANRESRRDHRVIKAYRVMEREDSLKIAATIEGLDFNEEQLEYEKVPKIHKVFILDPRIVKSQFKAGFEKGYSFARALDASRKNGERRDDIVSDATIGEITISKRKHLFARIVSPIICEDAVVMKEVLGDEGLRGMKGSHAPRHVTSQVIHLAQFAPGVIDSEKTAEDYINTLETDFIIHSISRVTFGPVQVVDR